MVSEIRLLLHPKTNLTLETDTSTSTVSFFDLACVSLHAVMINCFELANMSLDASVEGKV